uniref:STE3 protein n=4 Tax=Papiliotrema flavescens TaxID=214993 RepID=A0A0E4G233_9TREE|nr:STE3 protein [Papiliotrema flavescens]
MLHADYPFWSFVGLVAVLLPLPWHWRARNVATLALIFWIALANLIVFVNSLVWADNFADHAPAWCDISGRIWQIFGYGIPACSLAQMRRLESVASTRRSVITAAHRRRRMWLEAAWCLLLPPFMLPLLYIAQGHRYDIYENVGCRIVPTTTWAGLIVTHCFTILIALAVLVYSALAIRWFLVRRLQFRAILAASQTGLSVSRYLRLIALAIVEVVLLLINQIISLVVVLRLPIVPYTSWSDIHYQYGLISQVAEAQLTPFAHVVSVLSLYAAPLYAFVFFIFFGLGEEAVLEYVRMYGRLLRLAEPVGLKEASVIRPPASPILFVPSLGVHTTSATGRPLRDGGRGLSSFDDKEDGTFDAQSPSVGGYGIPMTVERSVV